MTLSCVMKRMSKRKMLGSDELSELLYSSSSKHELNRGHIGRAGSDRSSTGADVTSHGTPVL